MQFIYFDLGNVLALFSHKLMYEQVAVLVGDDALVAPHSVMRKIIFGDSLSERVERGIITEKEQYQIICDRLAAAFQNGSVPSRESLAHAMSDIFTFNNDILPLLESLAARGIPRGILSNTGTLHWRHCTATFPAISQFIPRNHTLSYKLRQMKPEAAIYRSAMEIARCEVPSLEPHDVIFLDDLADNVSGANTFGFDACQYTTISDVTNFFKSRNLL